MTYTIYFKSGNKIKGVPESVILTLNENSETWEKENSNNCLSWFGKKEMFRLDQIEAIVKE